jgi:hypothetical protein
VKGFASEERVEAWKSVVKNSFQIVILFGDWMQTPTAQALKFLVLPWHSSEHQIVIFSFLSFLDLFAVSFLLA